MKARIWLLILAGASLALLSLVTLILLTPNDPGYLVEGDSITVKSGVYVTQLNSDFLSGDTLSASYAAAMRRVANQENLDEGGIRGLCQGITTQGIGKDTCKSLREYRPSDFNEQILAECRRLHLSTFGGAVVVLLVRGDNRVASIAMDWIDNKIDCSYPNVAHLLSRTIGYSFAAIASSCARGDEQSIVFIREYCRNRQWESTSLRIHGLTSKESANLIFRLLCEYLVFYSTGDGIDLYNSFLSDFPHIRNRVALIDSFLKSRDSFESYLVDVLSGGAANNSYFQLPPPSSSGLPSTGSRTETTEP